MTVFAGHYGAIELQRIGSSDALSLSLSAENLNTTRKRIALTNPDGSEVEHGLITSGDRIRITTGDARGLPFRFYTDNTNTTYIDDPGASVLPLEFFANVDAMGQIRMYRTFADALSNPGSRFLAIPLSKAASSANWPVTITQLAGAYNTLGRVEGFTINTERVTVDTTTLGDKYQNYQAAQVNGSGSVDCKFDFSTLNDEELPIALCQLIQKIEIGSRFNGKFYVLEPGLPQPPGYTANNGLYYEVEGIMTNAGVDVAADQIVECSFDFVVNGEFKLRAGVQAIDLTTEADVSIGNESTLEELGVLEENN